MATFDEEIARHLQAAAASGELAQAQGFGKPLIDGAGWDDTPPALRMPFKILKDAGVAPPEIALFHERARLRAELEAATGEDDRRQLMLRLSELEQRLALRLESLRANASL